MSRPDFLIIGAMKSGTSTLAAQLGEQDGIFMTVPKEPNFFSDDGVFARGRGWYAALFDDAAPGDLKGEASTHYTKLPTYPDTLVRAQGVLDAPRLVYMIRNPVERAVSHFIHEWSQGLMSDDISAEFARNPEIIDYGLYAMQIRPWIEAYGADAIHLTSLEAIQADPQGVLSEVAAFVGYTGKVTWVEARARENVSAERIRKFPLHRLLIDNPVAETLRRALVPQRLRDRIKRARQMHDRPELPDTLRAALEVTFAEDYAELAGYFPGHARLAASYPFVTI
jgi:hypothetical protein